MTQNTLLKVLEQLLHKIKANRRREMGKVYGPAADVGLVGLTRKQKTIENKYKLSI